MSVYGHCPRCGAPGKTRERRPNGNDVCEYGCVYPSRGATAEPTVNDAWKEFENDFNAMTDEEIETETQIAQNHIDENEAWVEAVALWKAAGKPRVKSDG